MLKLVQNAETQPDFTDCWVVMLDGAAYMAYTHQAAALAEVHMLRSKYGRDSCFASKVALVDTPL